MLIITFALLGALLVYLMFTINLTVTEGTVNAFVFYVNIASVNKTIFFPLHQFYNEFVSITSLDFGIYVKVTKFSGILNSMILMLSYFKIKFSTRQTCKVHGWLITLIDKLIESLNLVCTNFIRYKIAKLSLSLYVHHQLVSVSKNVVMLVGWFHKLM